MQTIDLREKILDEATRLFVAEGYHGISMREIAEAVGVSKAGLYYHFRDKEDLFLAILRANLDDIELMAIESRGEATARGQITALVRAIFSLPPERRAIIRLASQEMQHVSEAARIEFGRLYRAKFTGQIEALLEEAMSRGEMRHVDPATITWVLLGMMYPFFYQAGERELPPTADTVDLLLSVFFDGVTAR